MNNGKLHAAGIDETLKLVAGVSAPEGLAARVKARLAVAEVAPEQGKLLAWPVAPRSSWWRGAVAAALLATVAAGGAVAYRWVAPAPVAQTLPQSARPTLQPGFSSAGAMRTPVTLNRPVALPEAALKDGRQKLAPTATGRDALQK